MALVLVIVKKFEFDGNKNVISRQLMFLRTKQKLSQAQLAAQLQVMNLNIVQQEISRIEHNRRAVTDFELVCLCKALRCTERELLQDYYEKYGGEE